MNIFKDARLTPRGRRMSI